MSRELIEELKKEADAEEAQGRALLAAAADKRTTIRVLEARLKQASGPSKLQGALSFVDQITTTERVTAMVKSMRARQITVSEVHRELEADATPLPPDIRARISTVLNRLESRGVIIKIAQGSGSTPNVYRLAERGAEAA